MGLLTLTMSEQGKMMYERNTVGVNTKNDRRGNGDVFWVDGGHFLGSLPKLIMVVRR
jgi:hypothetical protein